MSQQHQEQERFVSSAWCLGAAQFVGSGATYALLYILTKLGVEQYGLWVLTLVLVGYLTPWATLGLANALIRFVPSYTNHNQRVAAYSLACRCSLGFSISVGAGLVIFARPIAAALLGGQEHWALVVLVAVLVPLEAQFQLGNGVLQARESLGVFALLTVVRYTFEVIVLAWLAWWLPNLEVMLGARAAILLALVLAQHFLVLKLVSGESIGAYEAKKELKRYLSFGLPMIPASFIWSLVMGVDRFMLEHLGRVSEVAIYAVADTLALVLLNYTRPINGILQPRFANLIDQRVDEVQRYLAGAVKYLGILLFPGAVGLVVLAEGLVDLISHPGFERAAGMMPWLVWAYLLIGLSNPLYHLVYLRRGGRLFLWLFSLCLGVNISLNLLLIPVWSGVGAALATLGCFGVYVGGLLVYCDVPTLRTLVGQWQPLATAAGCSVMMGVALLFAKHIEPGLGLPILIGLGVMIYGLSIWVVGLVSHSERRLLLAPLSRIKIMRRSPFKSTT